MTDRAEGNGNASVRGDSGAGRGAGGSVGASLGSANASGRPVVFEPDGERRRLREAHEPGSRWYRWGPYLADRQWGTVREDYSANGDAWNYFPHDHARSRAYRWGEDGLLGISDDQARLCFALALWNEADPIVKERLFGLTGPEGNHGEDVKESYYYLDNTPTHTYMKALYRYPQRAFPYEELVEENGRRGRSQPEYELADTGIFAEDRFFDVVVEYAKQDPEDLLVRISVTNRGPDPAPIRLLPTLWFRNTWAWGRHRTHPRMRGAAAVRGAVVVAADHPHLGPYLFVAEGDPDLLFTENETNAARLWHMANATPWVKDGINDAVVGGRGDTVNPAAEGTKVAAHYSLVIPAGGTTEVRLRLLGLPEVDGPAADPIRSPEAFLGPDPFRDAESVFSVRKAEADAFYDGFGAERMTADSRIVQRQAFAGLLWTKQFYHYNVAEWLGGDPASPPPPPERKHGRNADWRELDASDILSMPDGWEYPWYASWDLAFHCIPLAQIDPDFAKAQLILLTREWYLHPNGQLPAYEWAFSDVNPPVHAWAAWRVYKIDKRITGRSDRAFLERVFHKLLLNFTWWVNRKDPDGHNVFQGGFLGLDNIGVFDRSAPLPVQGYLGQADGTAWMGMYCLNMLAIALELAREDIVYEDVATKFFEHFLYIAGALNGVDVESGSLWDEEDEFFYDSLHRVDTGEYIPLKVRSLVGLIPLLAVETLEPALLDALPAFRERMRWFLANRPHLSALVASWEEPGEGERRLLALVHGHRMKALLQRMLDPDEFLSDHGVRSLSRYHLDHPYSLWLDGVERRVVYEPGESQTGLFGGNSNWRGPVWFPINYLLIEALQKFHHYYGDDFTVPCPSGSAVSMTLWEVAEELSRRLIGLFLPAADGVRPALRGLSGESDAGSADRLLFHEYFHGDTGAGLGASHQTGWTALVAKLLEQTHRPMGSPGDGRSALLWALRPTGRVPGPVPEVPGPVPEVPGPVPEVPGPVPEVPGPASEVPGPTSEAGSGANTRPRGG